MTLLNTAQQVVRGTQPQMAREVRLGTEQVWPDKASSPYTDQVLADAPILYWPLEDAAGSASAHDLSGYSRDGVAYNSPTFGEPGLVPSQPGTSVDFPTPQSQHISIDYAPWMNVAAFTLSFVYKPRVVSGFRLLASRWHLSNNWTVFNFQSDNATIKFQVGTSGKPTVTGPSTQANQTYHIVGRFDPVANQGSLFVNGVKYDTATSGALPAPDQGPIHLNGANGGLGWEGSYSLSGWVQHYALFDTALSDARIAAHYATTGIV